MKSLAISTAIILAIGYGGSILFNLFQPHPTPTATILATPHISNTAQSFSPSARPRSLTLTQS